MTIGPVWGLSAGTPAAFASLANGRRADFPSAVVN